MRVEFHPEALAEYEAAAKYYAGRQFGLESRFIDCVESALQEIAEAPTRHRIFEDDARRFLTHIFPYAVLYTIETDFILIIASMHLQRKPGYWRQRMDLK